MSGINDYEVAAGKGTLPSAEGLEAGGGKQGVRARLGGFANRVHNFFVPSNESVQHILEGQLAMGVNPGKLEYPTTLGFRSMFEIAKAAGAQGGLVNEALVVTKPGEWSSGGLKALTPDVLAAGDAARAAGEDVGAAIQAAQEQEAQKP